MKKVILGTEYEIDFINQSDNQDMVANDWCGMCDFDEKKIYIARDKLDSQSTFNATYRHELIHAYLHESGIALGMQFHTEEMVDWLAWQFEKMEETLR